MDDESNLNQGEKGKRRRSASALTHSGKLRTHFRNLRSLEPIFLGSQVRLTPNAKFILCDCGDAGVKIVHTSNAAIAGVIQQPEENITCFTALRLEDAQDCDSFRVVTASHNGLLRLWQVNVLNSTPAAESDGASLPLTNINLIRSWKAQTLSPAGRICSLGIDASNSLLASGATDGSIRIWDLVRKSCTHFLRGHTGIVSLIRFFNTGERHILLTSAVGDGQLRAWDLTASASSSFTQLTGHSSVVTDAIWSHSGHRLVTVSRDQLLVVWDGRTLEKLRSWPCFEQLEAVVMNPFKNDAKLDPESDDFEVITAGSRGELRTWNVQNGKCMAHSAKIEGSDASMECDSQLNVGFLSIDVVGNTSDVFCATTDHRLMFYSVQQHSFENTKQIPGDVGEVLDVICIAFDEDSAGSGFLAVATNSPLIRIYDTSDWRCHFLSSHRSAVTSLASSVQGSSSLLISGSRDNDVFVWMISIASDRQIRTNVVARAAGHTAAVLSVAAISGANVFLSAGVDLTIKLWPLPTKFRDGSVAPEALSSLATVKAHDKDINSVAFSPNGRYVASGSQDKTAKIWLVESSALQLLGVLRGHRRAIWSVDFSPIDQILATASADGTLKLWALANLSCLRTFEGHDVSILRCRFMNRGSQLISGGADGVVKAWSLQTGECVATLDVGHDDRVWAVCPIADGRWLVTGSADERLIIWNDYTSDHVAECTKRDHVRALDAQRLENLLVSKNYTDAFKLALSLHQPARLWRVVRELRHSDTTFRDDSGLSTNPVLSEIVQLLDTSSLAELIRIVSAWNTNTKFVLEAQFMLHIILHVRPLDDLLSVIRNDLPSSEQQALRDSVEALIAYTQRHFARVDRLSTQSAFVDFAWSQLKLLEETSS